MKAFSRLMPGRVPPEDRPVEVTEAKKRWKQAVANRHLLCKLIALVAEHTTKVFYD
jgi:hypothetical protein